MADTNKPNVTLTLFINKDKNRVVFAEARKDFVDFLFSLLTLPLGSVTQILSRNEMVGCIGSIYESVEDLKESYFLVNSKDKETLLKPRIPEATTQIPLLVVPPQAKRPKFYGCTSGSVHLRISENPHTHCNQSIFGIDNGCNYYLSNELEIVPDPLIMKSNEQGYLNDDEMVYLVTDDLTVKPLSAMSMVSLLKMNGIKDVGLLEEKVVYLDMDQGLELLKASLQSKRVLTSLFLSDLTKPPSFFLPFCQAI